MADVAATAGVAAAGAAAATSDLTADAAPGTQRIPGDTLMALHPESRRDPALWARLQAFALDDPSSALSFSKRLARENGWSSSHTHRVVLEYRRFLYLCRVAGHACSPSDAVDQAWHLHLVYTRSYWDDLCGKVLGTPLHHGPTHGGRAEREKHDAMYVRTLDSYHRELGEDPPADIWPPSAVRFGHDLAFVRVNRRDYALVPRSPRALIALATRSLQDAATRLVGRARRLVSRGHARLEVAMGSDRSASRRSLVVLAAIVALLAFATCGDSAPTAPVAPAPAPLPVIRFGIALSLTGPRTQEALAVRHGLELWATTTNDKTPAGLNVGGTRHRVELVFRDDEGNPATARRQIRALVQEDGIHLLFTPYSSDVTMEASLEAEALGALMVGRGSSDALFDRGLVNLYSVVTPSNRYASNALAMLAKQGAKTIAIVHDDSHFATEMVGGLERDARALSMSIATYQPFRAGSFIGDPVVVAVQAAAADVIVCVCYAADGLNLLRVLRSPTLRPKALIVTIGPALPGFAELAGGAAEHVLCPVQWDPAMPYANPDAEAWFGSARAFAQAYTSRYGYEPGYHAAEAAAGAFVLASAIEAAGTTKVDEVRAALRRVDLQSFYGPIRFDARGRNLAKPMGVIQIQNGARVLVADGDGKVNGLVFPLPALPDANAGSGS